VRRRDAPQPMIGDAAGIRDLTLAPAPRNRNSRRVIEQYC